MNLKIGDLVVDRWGEIAIIISRADIVPNRFRVKYLHTGAVSTAWGAYLHYLATTETQKKVDKIT